MYSGPIMYISYQHHKVTIKRHRLLGCPTMCLVQTTFIRLLHLWTSNLSNVDWALPLCYPADCMAESSECSYRPHDRLEIYDQITHGFHSAGVLNLRGTRSLSGDMQHMQLSTQSSCSLCFITWKLGVQKNFYLLKGGTGCEKGWEPLP